MSPELLTGRIFGARKTEKKGNGKKCSLETRVNARHLPEPPIQRIGTSPLRQPGLDFKARLLLVSQVLS